MNVIPTSIPLKGSDFSKELEQLFLKIETARDSQADRMSRVKAALSKANELTPAFKEVILKYVGLKIEKFVWKSNGSFEIMTHICIGDDAKSLNAKMKKIKTINDLKNNRYWPLTIANHAYDGVHSKWFYPDEYSKKELMDLKKLSENYNRKLGTLDSGTMFQKKPIAAIMYFDLGCTILAREVLGLKAKVINYLECTAILLHEIGHTLNLCKNALDQYYRMGHLNNLVYRVAYSNKLSTKDKVDIAISNSKYLGKDKPDNIARMFETGSFTGYKVAATLLLVLPLLLISDILLLILLNIVFSIIIADFSKLYLTLGRDYKSSDVGGTKGNNYLQEWDSDKYVVKHGLGSYVGTGLDKLRFNMIARMGPMGSNTSYDLMLAYLWSTALRFMWAIWHVNPSDGTHGHPTKRLNALINSTIEQIKNTDDIALKNYFLGEFYRLEKLQKQEAFDPKDINSGIDDIKNFLHRIQEYINAPVGLSDVMSASRQTAELKQTYLKLKNNRVYVREAELKITK